MQNQRVFVSTASTQVLTVQDLGCPDDYVEDCEDKRGFLFLTNESLTWIPNSKYNAGIQQNLGLDTSGDAGFDTVTLGWQGSAAEPSVEHTNMLSIADSNYWLGLFGINPRPSNYTSFEDPQLSFLERLRRNNSIPSLSWGYTAGAQYRLDAVFGSLTLGGYDENRFTRHDISWPFYSDVARDMLVNLQSITTDQGSPSDLLTDGSISIFLDSSVPHIWLPESACSAFEEAFGLSWDDRSELYLVNGSTHSSLTDLDPTITFTLGTSSSGGETVDIVLPYSAFDLNVSFPIVAEESYYFPLKRAANSTQYTLGRTFFQEAYVIYDYERQNFTVQPCSWDQDLLGSTSIRSILSPEYDDTNNEDNPNSNSSGSLPGGAIAGTVVGIIALFTLLAILAFILRRRRKNKATKARAALETRSSSSASSNSSTAQHEGKPHISAPIGGELCSSAQIHEMSAPQKVHAQELDSPYKLDDPSKVGYVEAPAGEGDCGHGKGGAHEVGGGQHLQGGKGGQVFELAGSEVQELEGSGPHSGVFGGVSGK